MERRLAAILAADVVAYSRLMAADEEGTLARLRALRQEFIDPTIARHHGRIVKLMGDGALVEFASVVDAVRCAIAIQRGMGDRDLDLPEDRRIRFRIGVNLGDVIIEGDDIYGDGVNIAARLEGLAEPGGIVISGTAFDHVKKAEAGFRYVGREQVKNIPEPVRAYHVILDPAAVGTVVGDDASAAPTRRRWSALAGALALIVVFTGALTWLQLWGTEEQITSVAPLDTHRIAVLPFANISADPEDEYFTDGMTEELISQLSRISELSVIARTSAMKYKDTDKGVSEIGRELRVGTILEGSVRKVGKQVRITAQLIDVADQAHLWSEDYDRDLEDIFAIQSEIASQVADALQVTLLAGARKSAAGAEVDDMEVYTLYLRGRYFLNQYTIDSLKKAQQYFEQALEVDPDYAPAYAGLAHLFNLGTWMLSIPPDEAYGRAKAMAEKALALDDTLAYAWTTLAFLEVDYYWNWDAAERAVKRALELDPSNARAHSAYGHRLLSAVRGRYDEAIEVMRRAVSLDPLSVDTNNLLGMVFRHARAYDLAIEQFEKTIETWPGYMFPHLGLGWTYTAKGRHDEAIEQIQAAVDVSDRSAYALGHLAAAYARAGRKAEALELVEELHDRASREPVTAAAFAAAYRGLGYKDQAFHWLEKMYEERHPEMLYLNVEEYDNLRSDPRFTELLKKVGLEFRG